MPQPTTETRRSGTINIRIQPAERALIDRAAESQGKSRSDFMLEASRRAAEETLLDRTLIRVDSATYDQFIKLLDGPATPNEKLKKLMETRAPWE